MRRITIVFAVAALATTLGAAPAARAQAPGSPRDLSLELVGQVMSTPATSIQYGYVSYLRGLSIFAGDTQNETTALFTFYTDTTTTRVIVNGPLKVIDREGTVTVYRNPSAGASFANPDSFRAGTPVLVAGLRQQVVIDTLSGAFTTVNLNTITSTSPFPAGSGQMQLGTAGERFRTYLAGQSNSPTPSAYIAGYTVAEGT
jgi:hypothetical protein